MELNSLPPELILHIHKGLDHRSQRAFAGTCRRIRAILEFHLPSFQQAERWRRARWGARLPQPIGLTPFQYALTRLSFPYTALKPTVSPLLVGLHRDRPAIAYCTADDCDRNRHNRITLFIVGLNDGEVYWEERLNGWPERLVFRGGIVSILVRSQPEVLEPLTVRLEMNYRLGASYNIWLHFVRSRVDQIRAWNPHFAIDTIDQYMRRRRFDRIWPQQVDLCCFIHGDTIVWPAIHTSEDRQSAFFVTAQSRMVNEEWVTGIERSFRFRYPLVGMTLDAVMGRIGSPVVALNTIRSVELSEHETRVDHRTSIVDLLSGFEITPPLLRLFT